MIHHFLMIAWLTTRFTLPKIYSAWLFPSGVGDLKFNTEGLYPQVKSLTYFFKKEKRALEIEPIRVQSFRKGLGLRTSEKVKKGEGGKSDLFCSNGICKPIYCVFSLTNV